MPKCEICDKEVPKRKKTTECGVFDKYVMACPECHNENCCGLTQDDNSIINKLKAHNINHPLIKHIR